MTTYIMNKIYSKSEVNANGTVRKPAFASFNRDVNIKNIHVIAEKMKMKGYRNGEPIQVLKAEYASEQGVTDMVDMNGNLIPMEEYKDYWLVTDGSHRSCAAALYNEWLTEQGKPTIQIPAIEIELQNGESVTEYCTEINITKKDWEREDYINGAANLLPNEPLLQRYNELVKTPARMKGIPHSTLNRIFCNSEGLSKPDLVSICNGQKEKGRIKKQIMPAYDIETGNKFILTCQLKGFRAEEIGKRYLVTEFNNLRNAGGGVASAFLVFDSITPEDISAMTNKHGNLIEQSVINHFQVMIQRVRKSIAQSEPTEKLVA